MNREPTAPGQGKAKLLEALLSEVKGKQGKLSRQLNLVPHHLPEYDRILEELDKSLRAEESLRRQFARR